MFQSQQHFVAKLLRNERCVLRALDDLRREAIELNRFISSKRPQNGKISRSSGDRRNVSGVRKST